ncbi:hypothetical protein GGTG_00427 [Gaeumannomyces tritici R3-111a-1]|uniref:PH domain-containing protein n=1 Tax=Gaeumannomyces tritici (strain R3-111a-1) TaxID=644352 RepID=J3NGN8_GAET3|nr:hypothetical protein GGTG_00427 [Gaeumannomyces tritici R3-111a-1]EJT80428.1 hypothetical protein GGTG_00427 [Gaeumannomyces tritici R3-111a-1]
MAGIEQLEIHSKSYIVRWVKVDDGFTVSWSVQPHKKSINFGIVKHPGTGGTNLATASILSEDSLGGDGEGAADGKGGLFSKRDASTAQEQLSKKGFIMVKWHGKCTADKVTTGTHDVPVGKGGMYGMVFDNTFSKQTSKNATFVVLTHPTGTAPQPSRNNMADLGGSSNANASTASLNKTATQQSPRLGRHPSESLDSLHSHVTPAAAARPGTSVGGASANCHTGILNKRRRKKGQGYARRFFSLDYATCTLSYYQNRNTSALRGAIPLSLAAIAADERRREISIDSGAEIWHLKANNNKDFADWAAALTKATRAARGTEPTSSGRDNSFPHGASGDGPHGQSAQRLAPAHSTEEEDREWQQVEALVSRVVGTRDALRRLVKDMSSPAQPTSPRSAVTPQQHLAPWSTSTPPVAEEGDGYFQTPQTAAERKPFWKRKSSANLIGQSSAQSPAASQQGLSTPSSVTTAIVTGNSSSAAADKRRSKSYDLNHDQGSDSVLQQNCKALLGDLDSVVVEFSQLLSSSKRRRIPVPASAVSRNSMESTSTAEEFFDAAEGDGDRTELLMIDNRSDESRHSDDADEGFAHEEGDDDGSSVSSVDEGDGAADDGAGNTLYHPAKPKSLAPLPITTVVKRRTTVPAATMLPPSLIAFVRKNVGKDLSTISMPVSSNEPISLLQRMAEQLEYAHLLDAAARQKQARDRLLYVTAFAISQFSSVRARERAIRKPFNPLLGETFELLRAEPEVPGGLRMVVEKVSHRPVRLALHADGERWSLAQAPAPTQKFWGKSMELTTEGKIRVTLRLPDGAEERYSWGVATVFLRNVVMGEKYVEPVGSMSVLDETSGARAAVEFLAKGMFGGRGEDVQVETWGPDGVHAGLALAGTWTGGLRLVEGGKSSGGPEIWSVGKLVDNAAQTYGFTAFAASLNEITELEKGRLPATDSRLRPDQRLAEQGKLDAAEESKVRLEEAQRTRRRLLEERGEQHRPRWFTKVADGPDGDEVWRIKSGKDGYWEERGKGSWTGVEDVFEEP